MNTLMATTFLVTLLLCSNVNAQEEQLKLPSKVEAMLEIDYPNWEYPRLSEPWQIAYWQKVKADPNLISGDFDGNGMQDIAIQIVHRGEDPKEMQRFLIAFLQHAESYGKFILESGSVDPGLEETLHLVKKGSKGVDLELNEQFTYPFDAVNIGSEKGSITYLWKDGKFQPIITSD